jgi:predicted transcriptional regulator
MSVSIESLLGSKTTLRILKVLIAYRELNVSCIARRANVNHKVAVNRLRFLASEGIVREKCFGRIRVFELNSNDERVRVLRELLNYGPVFHVS